MYRRRVSRLSTAIFGIFLFALAGCIRSAPRMPRNLSSAVPINYSSQEFDDDVQAYRNAVKANQLGSAKAARDSIVFRVIAQIDSSYGHFEGGLTNGRAAFQTGSDAAQLGLTAAATIVGASAVKDILTATSTALQGTSLSIDKNFYEQKTTESLVSQMRASRKALQAQILLSLSSRDVISYPLEAAWIDVVGYYYAGTIPSALVDIASSTGSAATVADQQLKSTVQALTNATPTQAKQAVSIRTVYTKLSSEISSGDATQSSQASVTLRKILDSVGVSYAADATGADLLAALKTEMQVAASDDTRLQKLNDAVQAATTQ